MARPLRIEFEGAVYHITSRGNEKRAIYRDDGDRLVFFKTLDNVVKKFNWLIHAYCLMENHYHLAVETIDATLSKGMRQLNGMYTQAFNKKHNRVGHLYQGRYKSILIQKDSHLLEACRYIVLNPIRAGIVTAPEGYRWSSYNAMTGRGKPESFLTTDWILSEFGANRRLAEKQYKDFIMAGIGKKDRYEISKHALVYGDDNFIDSIKNHINGKGDLREIVKKERYTGRPKIQDIIGNNVKTEDKDKGARNKKVIDLIYNWGYSQKEVADNLNLHYSSISKILHRGKEQAKAGVGK